MDLLFNIATRELVLQNADFATTTDPSAQNGGVLLYARACNLLRPDFQIGIQEVIGAGMSKLAYEMNRWKAMAIADGAASADWQASNTAADFNLRWAANYD